MSNNAFDSLSDQVVFRPTKQLWTEGDRFKHNSVDELAGIEHIPNAEIETPKIDWRYTQRGDRLPSDGSQHKFDESPVDGQTPAVPDETAVTFDGSPREPEGFDGI